jgi:hypothetical protein
VARIRQDKLGKQKKRKETNLKLLLGMDVTMSHWLGLSVGKLRAELEKRGLSTHGHKPELQGRLLEQVLQSGAGGNTRKRKDISPPNVEQKKRGSIKQGDGACALAKQCHGFLATLGINKVYLDPTHDRCYCESCGSHIPKVLERENDTSPYEVPHGWCGFGLKLPPKAEDLQIFEWCVTYHGCPAKVVPSILAEGNLLLPGDQLLDGTKLPNRLTRGGKDRIQLYTSPSVLY